MNARPIQTILNLFQSKGNRRAVSLRGRTTRLSVESLEHRTLLAANIFESPVETLDIDSISRLDSAFREPRAALALAAPASARGATQILGEGVIVAVRDGETPAFTEGCPDPGGDYSNFGDLTISLTDGNLRGCWYTLVEEYKFSPSEAAEPVVYQERGREVFVGELWDGNEKVGEGTFETTYKFTGKYADASLVEEIHGRCQHPLVNGTGTGVFENATGRVDFKDDVESGILNYRGHIKLESPVETLDVDSIGRLDSAFREPRAALALAAPASARGTTQISGEGVIVAVRDGETPAFTADCPDPGGDYSNFGDLTISLTSGNLRGCWYTLVEEYKFSPNDAAEPVVYQERGREVFVGELWDGNEKVGEGTFETTYKFTGKYADASLVEEIHGRCQHPLVNGTGTGVFEGYTGRVDFKDDVGTGILNYRGHLKPSNGG